jgi:CRP-like cAMP-binding protein
LLVAFTQRLRKMDVLIEDLRFLDLKDRLAKTLYRLAQEHGRTVVGGGLRIDFKISQEELGSLVGATRENVNKLIRAWVEAGVLETSQSTLIIRQPAGLLAQ